MSWFKNLPLWQKIIIVWLGVVGLVVGLDAVVPPMPERPATSDTVQIVEDAALPPLSARDLVEAQAALRVLWDEFQVLRRDPTFHEIGFGSAGPHGAWLERAERMYGMFDRPSDLSSERFLIGVAFGHMMQAGLEMAMNGGQAGDMTEMATRSVAEALALDIPVS